MKGLKMNYLERYNKNKTTYERNRKEIFDILLRGNYPKEGRLIIVIGVENFSILEFKVKYLIENTLESLDTIINYIIAYKFVD